jgi:hypothetical protein
LSGLVWHVLPSYLGQSWNGWPKNLADYQHLEAKTVCCVLAWLVQARLSCLASALVCAACSTDVQQAALAQRRPCTCYVEAMMPVPEPLLPRAAAGGAARTQHSTHRRAVLTVLLRFDLAFLRVLQPQWTFFSPCTCRGRIHDQE